MRKRNYGTGIAFAICLCGVALIRHFTLAQETDDPVKSYVAEAVIEERVESIEIAEDEVPLADEIEDTDDSEDSVVAKRRPSQQANALVVKPQMVKIPSLGEHSKSSLANVLNLVYDVKKGKLNILEASAKYGFEVYKVKNKTEAELKTIAVAAVKDHLKGVTENWDKIASVIDSAEKVHNQIKEDIADKKDSIDSVKEDIKEAKGDLETVKKDISDVIDHVEDRQDEIQDKMDEIAEDVKERHENVKTILGGLIHH